MIRIHLQPARRRLLPVLLLGLGIFLVSALGLAYLAREEHPSLPAELAALSQSFPPPAPPQASAPEPEVKAPEPQVAQPAAPAGISEAKAPPLPPAAEASSAVREEGKLPQREERRPPLREETKAAQSTAPRPTPAKGQVQAPALPPAGPFCLRILQLHERLPAVVRCDSLSGTGAGAYTIKGTIPAGDFPQLIVLLDGLERLPSRATLSSWREGKKEDGDHRFKLQGQFTAPAQPTPAPLDSSEAAGLFIQAAALARKSRLGSVRVGAPLLTPVGKGVAQQRQKLWATGSYPQLKGFVENLVRQQPQLRLEEVMLVPLYKGEAQWKQAQFYAVLSTAVRAAR